MRSRSGSAVVFAATLCCGACNSSDAADRIHPKPDLVVADLAPTAELSIADERPGSAASDSLLRFYGGDALEVTIGAMEAPLEEVFGEIAQVAFTGDRIVILDSKAAEARIFDLEGELVEVIGRPGRGPGDFASPRTLAVDSGGRLYIGDLVRRVQVFRPGREGYELERVIQTGVSPVSFCLLGETIVVQGVNLGDSVTIRTYDLDGAPRAAFGRVYRSTSAIINYTLSQGLVGCDPVTNTIVFAPDAGIGEVRGYDPDGTLRWRTAITDYLPVTVIERADGYEVGMPAGGHHFVASLVELDEGRTMIQLAFVTRDSQREGRRFAKLHTFVLENRSGMAVARSDALGEVVAVADRRFAIADQLPYPRMAIGSAGQGDPE